MISDLYLKSIFIPFLGLLIPFASGLVNFSLYSTFEMVGTAAYFIITSFCIWRGCNWIHSRLRPLYGPRTNSLVRIASITGVNVLYGCSVGGILVMIWFGISGATFEWNNILKFVAFVSLAVIVFTLVYEVAYLAKEREIDNKIVNQLDKERAHAEMEALKNELDPHFIFNSLNILSHLINADPEKASRFNHKLATVYQYFLINKDRDLISVQDELMFLQDYFYLLKIKHESKLSLEAEVKNHGNIMILPFALQTLVENAIKHNEFTEEYPLKIRIGLNGEYVKVTNNINPKMSKVNSFGIGLKNLRSRYKLLCKKEIVIESIDQTFVVKLPIIHTTC